MFPRVEIRFEIVEIRMESKGDHKAPISKRKKKTPLPLLSVPTGRTTPWTVRISTSAGQRLLVRSMQCPWS